MEFGSLGLGSQSQASSTPSTNTQTGGANAAQSATLETNPENVVTPTSQNGAAENDLRRQATDQGIGANLSAGNQVTTTEPLTSRRTTLNFDSEQNRIFLEVVDRTTEEVVERIPSENLTELVEQAVPPLRDVNPAAPEEADSNPTTGTI